MIRRNSIGMDKRRAAHRPITRVTTGITAAAVLLFVSVTGIGGVTGPARADDPGDEVLAPVVGEACLYVFVGLLISSAYAPSEALRVFEPALVACNQVPAAKERRYCQPDHYMFDDMNRNSPNDIDTGPFGLLTDEVAALERTLGVPAAGRASPHMDEHMDCVDRRKQSGAGQFVGNDEPPAPAPADGGGSPDLTAEPELSTALFSAAAGLTPNPVDTVDEQVASSAPGGTRSTTLAAAAVGDVAGTMSLADLAVAAAAGLATVLAVLRLALARRPSSAHR